MKFGYVLMYDDGEWESDVIEAASFELAVQKLGQVVGSSFKRTRKVIKASLQDMAEGL